MKLNWPAIVLFLVILVMGFFLFQTCNKGNSLTTISDSIKIEKAVNDSLKKSLATISFDNEKIKDNYRADTIAYKRKIDSQAHIIAVLQGKFKVTKDSIGTLYTNLKKFYLDHDTLQLQITYQNLATQLSDANQQLFAIQIARDSADYIRDKEIQNAHQIIAYSQDQINKLQALLKICTDNGSDLVKIATKAQKKAKLAAILNKVELGVAGILAAFLVLHK